MACEQKDGSQNSRINADEYSILFVCQQPEIVDLLPSTIELSQNCNRFGSNGCVEKQKEINNPSNTAEQHEDTKILQ